MKFANFDFTLCLMFNQLTFIFMFMSQKRNFIARIDCFDNKGSLCYLSRRTVHNRSVIDIFDSFKSLIIPCVIRRLPPACTMKNAILHLYDEEFPTKDGSENYSFEINF